MKNFSPEISIIIPLFNRKELIKETLESLLPQTFQNWECIIVDDHSADNGIAIVKEFSKADSRFRWYLRPEKLKKGANSCRNYGLEMARGKFIYWLDSDDIAHPELLEKSMKYIEEYKFDYCRFSREIFFGNFKNQFDKVENNENPEILKFSPILLENMLTNKLEFNTCNVLWRKASLKNEKFNEEIVYADEWEFYSRLLIKKLKGVSIHQTLIYGRKHTLSTTFEFRNKDKVRRNSKIKAIHLVLQNLVFEVPL